MVVRWQVLQKRFLFGSLLSLILPGSKYDCKVCIVLAIGNDESLLCITFFLHLQNMSSMER